MPADVDDVLLWRLSVDVAATHQPGPHGRCTSLLCADAPVYPCPPATAARRAAHAARLRPLTARGRATVPPAPDPGRAAPISTAVAARQPVGTATYRRDVWPPPLRRPTAARAA
ncbi:hypothetical protein [Micromonospora sp. Llam0]|uniref:hypothetical protein n=1 Tax=Micromonospora sp. Llam0 TaxID=2485143 RepID=UPI0011CE432E|nr:hypothetical protein [Micromonospora sp. Llam0]